MIKTCKDLGMELCFFCKRINWQIPQQYSDRDCNIERYADIIRAQSTLQLIKTYVALSRPTGRHSVELFPYFLKALKVHCPERLEQIEKLLILL